MPSAYDKDGQLPREHYDAIFSRQLHYAYDPAFQKSIADDTKHPFKMKACWDRALKDFEDGVIKTSRRKVEPEEPPVKGPRIKGPKKAK